MEPTEEQALKWRILNMKIRPKEIKALRERHNLTQRQLAESLYMVKRERITDWETGRRDCPAMVGWAMILQWDGQDIRHYSQLKEWQELYAL